MSRLVIVASPRLHVAVDDRALCGRAVDVEMDGYPDRVGLQAWNLREVLRCHMCERVLEDTLLGSTRAAHA